MWIKSGDIDRLEALLSAFESGRLNRSLNFESNDTGYRVDTCIAQTLEDIEPRSGTTAGSGSAFQVKIAAVITDAGLDEITVYNLSEETVPAESFVYLVRETTGNWVMVECDCGFVDTCEDCVNCPTAPPAWTLTVSGMGGVFCDACDLWEGEFVLTNNCLWEDHGSPCVWSSTPDPQDAPCAPACTGCSRWQLIITGDSADVVADGAGMGTYNLPLGSFDCDGTNVLEKVTVSPHCSWPDTVTITPLWDF